MGLLCDFMYHGQVNVQQDRLPRYLWKVYKDTIISFSQFPGSCLKIRGKRADSSSRRKREDCRHIKGREPSQTFQSHDILHAQMSKERPVATGSVVPVFDCEGEGETKNRVKEEEDAGDHDGYMESGVLDFTGSSYGHYNYQESIGILPTDFSPQGFHSMANPML